MKRSEKMLNWMKKHRIWFVAGMMSLLPLIWCMISCALEGRSIGEVYLPSSEWNDELFYFKQVEGILHFGYPQGYFGFNESHALKMSFAAWSPVLVWPHIIWGLLFGWNLLTPVYCNIFLMMLAIFIFVMLVKPSAKQLAILSLFFVSFSLLTRFMLSGMPEIICVSMTIIVLSIGYNYLEKERTWKLVLLFALTFLMTLMRPYLILFMILPMFLWFRKNKWLGAIGSVVILGITGGIYMAINHYLSAEYFSPLFKTTWLEVFLQQGILSGMKYMLGTLWGMGGEFTGMLLESFQTGLPQGALFAGFVLVLVILLYQAYKNYRKKETNELIINGYLALTFLGMLAALLLMYKLREGARHLITFITPGLFAISLMKTKYLKRVALVAGLFVYLYGIMALDDYEYQVPYYNEERGEQVKYWEGIFEQNLSLVKEDTPNFDNVVVWVFKDIIEEKTVNTTWQCLYALPEGFGVSCCENDFVLENFEDLQGKYLAVVPEGNVDALCKEKAKKEVGRSEGMVLYELR